MSLLDEFLMVFQSDGLKEVPDSAKKAEDALDDLADTAEEAEEKVNKLDEAFTKNLKTIKNLAIQATKSITPFVVLGKAIQDTMQFAEQAVEVADAAKKAGMTLEAFQAKDGNKYTIFTHEDVINAKEYEMVSRDIRMGTAAIGANISRLILPALISLNKIAKTVVDFFVEHGTFIQALFIGIATAITVAAIPSIVSLGIALWTALAPILPILLPITAAIIGIALLVEDFYKWIKGEPSAAGLIFGDFETFKNRLAKGISEIPAILRDAFVNALNLCGEFFKNIGSLLSGFWNSIPAPIKEFINWLISPAKAIAQTVALFGAIAQNAVSVLAGAAKKPDGSHADGLDYVPYDGYIAELHKGERVQTAEEATDWRSGLIAAKKAVNFTANYPLNSIPGGAISNAYNNSNANATINIGDVTIQTQATDAKGIATDFAQYIKQAMISLDDGMLA